MSTDRGHPQAVKDEESAHPIALAWRPVVSQIAQAFVIGDYALARGVVGVDTIPPERAEQIRRYVAAYGATLIELPEATYLSPADFGWTSSTCPEDRVRAPPEMRDHPPRERFPRGGSPGRQNTRVLACNAGLSP
jgi:hypothetical protein